MLQQRGDAMHCTECGREYDAQNESLTVCASDDCPSNTPTMVRTAIGSIDNGIYGRDEYILVTSNEGNITVNQVRDYLMPFFYHNSSQPGGYFCDTISVVHEQYSKNRAIATVHHRYDI